MGTTEIQTDQGIYSFDGRIHTKTPDRLFGYPKQDNSNLIEDSKQLEEEIINALKSFKDEFYQKSIDWIILSKS